jgi:DNA-binding NarL/FixJ family response regulator
MINIIVIDAEKQERDKIAALLSAQKDFRIMGLGEDGYDALKLVNEHKPDIAVLDAHLKYNEREEIPLLLKCRSPATAVVMLAGEMSDTRLCEIICNKVSGFLLKKTDIEPLPEILRTVVGGGYFFNPEIAGRVIHICLFGNDRKDKPQALPWETDHLQNLSKTELQILTCLGKGYAGSEIAQSLNLAAGTVRNYISSIMCKTGLHSQSQLVLYAIQCGLVPVNWESLTTLLWNACHVSLKDLQ